MLRPFPSQQQPQSRDPKDQGPTTQKPLTYLDLGLKEYSQAYEIQKALHTLRREELIPDTLILLEHPPVFTLGKRGSDADILWSPELCHDRGISVIKTDRGGQVTYHGPGQLVGYVIVNLYQQQRKIRWFVEELEQVIVRVLKNHWALESQPSKTDPGVWVGKNKITAVGIAIQQKVTLHGFALNVTTDLSHFSGIIPCGIQGDGRWVTSLEQELSRRGAHGSPSHGVGIASTGADFTGIESQTKGTTPDLMTQVKQQVLEEFCRTYGYYVTSP